MVGASAVVFVVLLTVLAIRLAAGADPALLARGAGHPRVRHVVIRRVYERIVITHLPPSSPPQPTSTAQQLSSTGGSEAAAPLTRAS